jgi:hypothetical protein
MLSSMDDKAYVPTRTWAIEARDEPAAVITTLDGKELRVRITRRECFWLIRGRHPA